MVMIIGGAGTAGGLDQGRWIGTQAGCMDGWINHQIIRFFTFIFAMQAVGK